jgi:UDP-2,4-diacetamido-2,4,6-trideoxy-beta-L-altropyranose hydrolase
LRRDDLTVVVRADASITIGSGHVMRCLTLAEALQEKGAEVHFVCREHEGHLGALIQERGFRVTLLPVSNTGPPETSSDYVDVDAYAAWIGALWETDAEQTRTAIGATREQTAWLVVDHYGLDRRWENALRPVAGRIMAIDDLANRPHDCDLLLDQNLVAGIESRYSDKVPERCELLLGPAYALLQPIYARMHDRAIPRTGWVRRILISFGGADGRNVTGRALTAFMALNRADIEVDVVLDADSPDASAIRAQVAGRSNIHLHSNLPSLAELMARADLAIGASGATAWERCCTGLPSIVITLAENQRPIAEKLHELGVVRWLGDEDQVDDRNIAAALSDILANPVPPDRSEQCRRLVDGRGTDRVRVAMTIAALSENGFRLRRVLPQDATMLFKWRNDPATIAASRQAVPVTSSEHARWFETALGDPDRQIYIGEYERTPVGTVRVDRRADGQEVSWTVAPGARGKGIGKAIVKMVADTLAGRIYADIKTGNAASAAIAEHAGLTLQSERDGMRRFSRQV